MAYAEFYCNPATGSNLNAGSDSGSPSMSDTAGTGSWTSTTNVYVSVTTTGTVTVGQYLSLYQSGATAPAYIARITSVTGGGGSAWTITVSSTLVAGTKPTTGTTYLAHVGGAWAGPSAANGHPFTFAGMGSAANLSSGGGPPRINFKNNATYAMTAAITIATSGTTGVTYQGYSSAPGDGGMATLIGATTGTSYIPLTMQGQQSLRDFIITQNGATGSAAGLVTASRNLIERVVVYNVCGEGIDIASDGALEQCEVTGCNTSNTANLGGILVTSGNCVINRCVIHGNTGSNVDGIFGSNAAPSVTRCLIAGNGRHGYFANSNTADNITDSWLYGNTGDGLHYAGNSGGTVVDNCILYGNGGYGVNNTGTVFTVILRNCAFGDNTTAPTTGQIENNNAITLTADPSIAGSTGNFTLNSTLGGGPLCKAAGIGAYTMTQTYTTPTTGSVPDVGGVQGSDTGSSGGYIIGG